jgi:hypothetical protein
MAAHKVVLHHVTNWTGIMEATQLIYMMLSQMIVFLITAS